MRALIKAVVVTHTELLLIKASQPYHYRVCMNWGQGWLVKVSRLRLASIERDSVCVCGWSGKRRRRRKWQKGFTTTTTVVYYFPERSFNAEARGRERFEVDVSTRVCCHSHSHTHTRPQDLVRDTGMNKGGKLPAHDPVNSHLNSASM